MTSPKIPAPVKGVRSREPEASLAARDPRMVDQVIGKKRTEPPDDWQSALSQQYPRESFRWKRSKTRG